MGDAGGEPELGVGVGVLGGVVGVGLVGGGVGAVREWGEGGEGGEGGGASAVEGTSWVWSVGGAEGGGD